MTSLVLASCRTGEGSLSTARGLENESFLEFVGKASNYRGGVDVNIDGKVTFKAKVHNENEGYNFGRKKIDRFKGEIYVISTGTHTITVSYKGGIIYKKQIFISAQETKKIILQ
jgi:hypothetical protein